MTIDDAIIHAEKVYEILKNKCIDCANEHKQLAEWLKDYKEIKSKQGASIKMEKCCLNCKWLIEKTIYCSFNFTPKYEKPFFLDDNNNKVKNLNYFILQEFK